MRSTEKEVERGLQMLRGGWVERTLNGPLSEDYPENIADIEDAFGSALADGKLSAWETTPQQLHALLQAKRIILSSSWKMSDLLQKIFQRILTGKTSRRLDEELLVEDLELVKKHRRRSSIKKIVDLGGVCEQVSRVIRLVELIDEERDKGRTYPDILENVVYWNDEHNILAFISHVEETTATQVQSPHELHKLGLLDLLTMDDARWLLTVARELSLTLAIDRCFREECSWQRALDIKPIFFNLPTEWEGMYGKSHHALLLRRRLHANFLLGDGGLFSLAISLRDVSETIKAPYSEVLAASLLEQET